MASRLFRSGMLAVALSIGLCGPGPAAAEYQFEDNVRDFMTSAKELMARDDLEDAALEYENILAIDVNHRDAALALFDVYLKLGAVAAAEVLMTNFPRMGVDAGQQSALRAKLDGVKAAPPPPRKRVFTAAAPAPVAGPAAPAAKTDPLDDLGDLEAPAPASAAPAAPPKPGPAPAPAPGVKDDLDDISL